MGNIWGAVEEEKKEDKVVLYKPYQRRWSDNVYAPQYYHINAKKKSDLSIYGKN